MRLNPVQQKSLKFWQKLVSAPNNKRNPNEYIYVYELLHGVHFTGFKRADSTHPYPETSAHEPQCNYRQCSQEWHWPVSAHFLEQLDLRCQLANIGPPDPENPRRKQPVWQWSQGSAFCFEKGHLLPNPAFYTAQNKPSFLQVVEAKAAVPAKTKISPGTKTREAVSQRDPGMVVCDLLTLNNGRQTRQQHLQTTQDGFVHFLITGHLPEEGSHAQRSLFG